MLMYGIWDVVHQQTSAGRIRQEMELSSWESHRTSNMEDLLAMFHETRWQFGQTKMAISHPIEPEILINGHKQLHEIIPKMFGPFMLH